ncbi:hypothetical protein FACS189449_07370 [Alphaproteobacteria bacterium]|nr:hypothetical protein FACS189449_07370 [Alphaproteobacteria bacterium]
MKLRNFYKMFMLLLCVCSVCINCVCMEVPLSIIRGFADECLPGLSATKNVTSIPYGNPSDQREPLICDFEEQYIVKVARNPLTVVQELSDAKTVLLAIQGAVLDNGAYKFILPTKYAIYKPSSGTFGEVKDVTAFSENEVSDGVYAIFFMEKAKGVHLINPKFKELVTQVPQRDIGRIIANFGTNFGKVCAILDHLRIKHKDLHFGNLFFDPTTCIVTLIDFRLTGGTYYSAIINALFLRMIFSGPGQYMPECIGNFFHNYLGEKTEVLCHENFRNYFVNQMLCYAGSERYDAKEKDLLSFEETNILLFETMKRIRPYFKKEECPTLEEFRKIWGLRKGEIDPEFFNFGRTDTKKGICSMCNQLWDLFLYESDNKEKPEEILNFILSYYKQERQPWHDEMLTLMCKLQLWWGARLFSFLSGFVGQPFKKHRH